MTATDIEISGDLMRLPFRTFGPDAYRLFLKAKRLPESRTIFNREDETYTIEAPARFAPMLDLDIPLRPATDLAFAPFLFDDQVAITKMALEAKRFAAWLGCGLGKGHPDGTRILTPSGWQAIENIRVGSQVIGRDGTAHNVIGVFDRGIQPTYEVFFDDGTSLTTDADHLWAVRTPKDKARSREWRTLPTVHLANVPLKYGTHGQSRFWHIPMVQPVEFGHKDLPLDPYVLGILLGYGSLGASVQWDKPDEFIADQVRSRLHSSWYDVNRLTGSKWSITSHASNNPIRDWLVSVGLNVTSESKFVPREFLFASYAQRLDLLRGLMDTDGYAGESPEFCSTSRQLAEAVVFLSQSFGGTASLATKDEPTYVYAGEKRIGQKAYRVVLSIPNLNPFSLPRKRDAYKQPIRGLGRWIDRIELREPRRTTCIAVDTPDQLYVADHFIVTHNTPIAFEFARHVIHRTGGRVLIITLNEIVKQFLEENVKFYGDTLPIIRLNTRQEMRDWCKSGPGHLAITNYEKMNPESLAEQEVTEMRHLAAVILDESNRLAAGGGKQKWALIKSCKGIEYKLSCTATPAPNDTMEFASQASFLEKMRTESDIIWTYFVRDAKTHRWMVKRHARRAFFEFMSSWSIYVSDPKKYGWRLGMEEVPEPVILTHDIPITEDQRQWLVKLATDDAGQGMLFYDKDTNAIQRAKLSQVAKGFVYAKGKAQGDARRVKRIDSRKPAFVADLIREEVAAGLQVLVWTVFDAESDIIAAELGDLPFELLTGKTKDADRIETLERFRHGELPVLISRASMLGFGMNFQFCGSMIFSGWSDSFVLYYQAVRRAYRFGQKRRLRVHLPVIRDLEGDMLENIFRKESAHNAAIEEMEANYVAARAAMGGGR